MSKYQGVKLVLEVGVVTGFHVVCVRCEEDSRGGRIDVCAERRGEEQI